MSRISFAFPTAAMRPGGAPLGNGRTGGTGRTAPSPAATALTHPRAKAASEGSGAAVSLPALYVLSSGCH